MSEPADAENEISENSSVSEETTDEAEPIETTDEQQPAEQGSMDSIPEIEAVSVAAEIPVDEAQIVSENVDQEEVPVATEEEEDIAPNEFYESIMADGDNHFKFFQKYSYWSPEQLVVEIKNNVWFPAKLTNLEEERQLLNLKCPSSKLLKKRNLFRGSDSGGDHKKQFNKWQWQAFVKALGNEYQYLSLFPDLNNEQTKEFYDFMGEFHASWVPEYDGEEGTYDSDDEEDEGTVW